MPFASLESNDAISFRQLRELDLEAPPQVGRRAHLAAASGLVCVDDALYVVADDEVHLGVFALSKPAPGRLVRLRTTALDLAPKARKRAKPDFEALVGLPATPTFEHGALLALGSGSTKHRVEATCIPFDAAGHLLEMPRTLDLEPLYAAVARVVGEVNIEGAIIEHERLLLFQRGNKGRGVNAVLAFDFDCVREALESGGLAREPKPSLVNEYDLGTMAGVPLGFTDAATLPDGSIVFAAVAEDTHDSYADGASAGAAMGVLDRERRLRVLRPVRQRVKIEGIHAQARDGSVQLLVVTDADDPLIPAALLTAELEI